MEMDTITATDHSPEAAAVSSSGIARIHRLIDTLPEDLRQPLVLSTLEEMTSAQIGVALGIPEGTVRTRIQRARMLLRQKLGPHHGESPCPIGTLLTITTIANSTNCSTEPWPATSLPEPDPSMRARIMARIDAATPPLGRMWLLGSVAACLAALLLAFLLHPANHPPEDLAARPHHRRRATACRFEHTSTTR